MLAGPRNVFSGYANCVRDDFGAFSTIYFSGLALKDYGVTIWVMVRVIAWVMVIIWSQLVWCYGQVS